MELTQKDLSALAGYTYRRLLDINKLLPDDEKLFVKGEGGKYDLALFVQHWVSYNVSLAKKDNDDDLNTVKAAHEHVKMKKSELELRKMKTELIEVEAIKRLWADIATEVMQKFLTLPSSLAPMLVMLESVEGIEKIIDQSIRDTLTAIADTPIPNTDDRYADADEDAAYEEE